MIVVVEAGALLAELRQRRGRGIWQLETAVAECQGRLTAGRLQRHRSRPPDGAIAFASKAEAAQRPDAVIANKNQPVKEIEQTGASGSSATASPSAPSTA